MGKILELSAIEAFIFNLLLFPIHATVETRKISYKSVNFKAQDKQISATHLILHKKNITYLLTDNLNQIHFF